MKAFALAAIYLGELERATPLLERALPAHRAHGDQHGVGWTLNYLAQIEELQGRYAQAAATAFGPFVVINKESRLEGCR